MGLFIPPEECRFDGLSLRCWKPGDGAALARAIRDNYAHLAPWMKWPKANERAEDSEERVRSNYGQWLKNEDFVLGLWDGDEVIGGSGFHLRRGSLDLGVAELGMWCAATRAGTQLGTRTLKALLDWASRSPSSPRRAGHPVDASSSPGCCRWWSR